MDVTVYVQKQIWTGFMKSSHPSEMAAEILLDSVLTPCNLTRLAVRCCECCPRPNMLSAFKYCSGQPCPGWMERRRNEVASF